MAECRMIFRVCKGAFRGAARRPRTYVALLWVAFLFLYFTSAVRRFCEAAGCRVSPWIFPHITASTVTQTFIIIGALLLFCDAPFLNSGSGWQILRAGRKKWFWGNMAYIWLMSLIYAVVLSLLPVFMTIPFVEWSDGWGRVLGSLAQTSAAQEAGLLLNYSLMVHYEPLRAMALTAAAVWLNAVLIGMVNYTCNLLVPKGLGAAISVALALSPLLIVRLARLDIGYYFSPPLWMYLANCKWQQYGSGPSLAYVYAVLLSGIGLCMALARLGIGRKDLNPAGE